MTVEWVRVGDIAQQSHDVVAVEPDQTYKTLGVLNRGRGVFERTPLQGAETKYPRFTHVVPGQLLYSKLFGWEGSVAVVPEGLEGFVVSPEFPVFDLRPEVDPGYIRHAVSWSGFVEQMATSTTGLGQRRQRVNVSDFVTLTLPLPPIGEQRRIAAHLDDLAQSVSDFEASSAGLPPGTLPILIRDALARLALPMTTVGDLVTVANETIHPGDPLQGASAFVGLEHIEPHTGQLRGSRPIYEETGRKFLFRPGQLTFGYLRPYLNKVWLADRTGLCSVEQFVLDPVAGVNADLLGHLLRSAYVLDRAVEATNRLQLPRLSLKTLLAMPVPDIRRTEADVVGQVGLLRDRFAEIHRLGLQRASLIGGLLPAARNEIFSAMR